MVNEIECAGDGINERSGLQGSYKAAEWPDVSSQPIMPLTFINVADGKIFHQDDLVDSSSMTSLINLTRFLQAEDVEIINLSVAPDNLAVIAIFHTAGWQERLEDLFSGRADWKSLARPQNPITRTPVPTLDPTRDMWDITQMSLTVHNLDSDTSPGTFRGSPDNVCWPSTLVRLIEFLTAEGSTVISLLVTSKQLVLVSNFKDDWVDRLSRQVFFVESD